MRAITVQGAGTERAWSMILSVQRHTIVTRVESVTPRSKVIGFSLAPSGCDLEVVARILSPRKLGGFEAM
jgi:hypothetical protein